MVLSAFNDEGIDQKDQIGPNVCTVAFFHSIDFWLGRMRLSKGVRHRGLIQYFLAWLGKQGFVLRDGLPFSGLSTSSSNFLREPSTRERISRAAASGLTSGCIPRQHVIAQNLDVSHGLNESIGPFQSSSSFVPKFRVLQHTVWSEVQCLLWQIYTLMRETVLEWSCETFPWCERRV